MIPEVLTFKVNSPWLLPDYFLLDPNAHYVSISKRTLWVSVSVNQRCVYAIYTYTHICIIGRISLYSRSLVYSIDPGWCIQQLKACICSPPWSSHRGSAPNELEFNSWAVRVCQCHAVLPNPRSADFRSVCALHFVISAVFSRGRRVLRAALGARQVTAAPAAQAVLYPVSTRWEALTS